MSNNDKQYLDLCREILEKGERQENRTGIDTISIFGIQKIYNLTLDGFPLLTTKKINFNKVKAELLGFLKGVDHYSQFPEAAQDLWKPWQPEGSKKFVPYGREWVKWVTTKVDWDSAQHIPVNQIQDVIDRLKKNPTDRRLIVSAWNVSDLADMALPPCHVMFQLKAYPPFLDLMMFQRSCDVPVGVPFNIASYALLLSMIAKEVGLIPRNFIHSMGDAHIYVDQIDGIQKQLERVPKDPPKLILSDNRFWAFGMEDIQITNYDPHPWIKFPVAV